MNGQLKDKPEII